MRAAAIIPAAGLSTRMGSTTAGAARKQFVEFHGAPILVHTLRKFDRSGAVEQILVPARSEDRERIAERLAGEAFLHPVRLVEGGATRQESVWNALRQIPEEIELIVVHDAVRPFLDLETLRNTMAAGERWGAAIAAFPAVDTVKQVERAEGDSNRIVATLPRERIVLAQTPQVFHRARLVAAFTRAQEEGFQSTDEASLLEHFGEDVFAVPGSARNWKITTPADLELAEMFFAAEARAAVVRND